jgi:hypothetical protein
VKRRLWVGAAILALAVSGCARENHAEKLADQVTRAIVANDMRPVASEFNAIVRPKLMERERVGRLSDQLAPLGKFKRTKENTPAGTPAGTHQFVAEFERGTRIEDMTLDADGKIAAFHIHPTGQSSAR